MRNIGSTATFVVLCLSTLALCSCSSTSGDRSNVGTMTAANIDVTGRLPQQMETSGQRVVLVDPSVHAWGAYDKDGQLLKAGLATAGSDWCPDIGRRCHTSVGTFHVASLGSPDCKSHQFPKPRGGAPMPYCMYFNGGQALHGSPTNEVIDGNISHGCVRMHVADAEWLRYNFVNVGTKVVVKPYE